MSEYYKKKIMIDLLNAIYLLTSNTHKVIIISLKSDLQSLYNQNYFSLKKIVFIIMSEDKLVFNKTTCKYYLSYIFLIYNFLK